ncbi:MAG: hypothetical protein KF729_17680 [Sandaracinaceae bacterium]|nr:hypothetical protein [Sandaracinaceae bacterium]
MTERDDEEVEETERREAEALAHALERGSALDALPEDALEAAALLRYSAGGGELPADREDALLAEVLARAARAKEREAAAAPAPAPLWRWLIGFTGVAIALALVLWFRMPSEEIAATELPRPSAALVSSGIERLGPGGDEAAFRDALRGYRVSVYEALEARYE